jgi:hypothetical protein
MGAKIEIVKQYGEGTAQDPIFLDADASGEYPKDQEFRGVQLEPVVTGVGYVQATLSSRADVIDGHAGWVTWPNGSVSAVAQDTIDPVVTAIRVYRTSGVLKLTVRMV